MSLFILSGSWSFCLVDVSLTGKLNAAMLLLAAVNIVCIETFIFRENSSAFLL